MKDGQIFKIPEEDEIAFVTIDIVFKKLRIAGSFGLFFNFLVFVKKAKMKEEAQGNDEDQG